MTLHDMDTKNYILIGCVRRTQIVRPRVLGQHRGMPKRDMLYKWKGYVFYTCFTYKTCFTCHIRVLRIFLRVLSGHSLVSIK